MAHFKPPPLFPDGIVVSVRCNAGETESGKVIPVTHYLEWSPSGPLCLRHPGTRTSNGKPYGGCGGENREAAEALFLLTGNKTRCMDIEYRFPDFIESIARGNKLSSGIRCVIPKEFIDAASDSIKSKYTRRRGNRPIKRCTTSETRKMNQENAQRRLASIQSAQLRKTVETIRRNGVRSGVLEKWGKGPLEISQSFRSNTLLRHRYLTRTGYIWTTCGWALFQPIQVESVQGEDLLLLGLFLPPKKANGRRYSNRCAYYKTARGRIFTSAGSSSLSIDSSLELLQSDCKIANGNLLESYKSILDQGRFVGISSDALDTFAQSNQENM